MDNVHFWSKVAKGEGCWLWSGARRKGTHAYGLFRLDGRWVRAHRVSWELTYGPVPVGLNVCHRCDNPPCVRPDHLFVGTQRANLADMTAKGRRRGGQRCQIGTQNAYARLTETTALLARQRYVQGEHVTAIAADYGVNPATIRFCVEGRTWKHVPMPEGQRPASNYRTKLSSADVAAIRLRLPHETRAAIARDYGVSAVAISRLAHGKSHC